MHQNLDNLIKAGMTFKLAKVLHGNLKDADSIDREDVLIFKQDS